MLVLSPEDPHGAASAFVTPHVFCKSPSPAYAYQKARKLNLALPLFEETLEFRRTKLGPGHPDTLETMNNLAATCFAAGDRRRALQLFEQTLELQKAKLGRFGKDDRNDYNSWEFSYKKSFTALPVRASKPRVSRPVVVPKPCLQKPMSCT